jgi:hypothetical protein
MRPTVARLGRLSNGIHTEMAQIVQVYLELRAGGLSDDGIRARLHHPEMLDLALAYENAHPALLHDGPHVGERYQCGRPRPSIVELIAYNRVVVRHRDGSVDALRIHLFDQAAQPPVFVRVRNGR